MMRLVQWMCLILVTVACGSGLFETTAQPATSVEWPAHEQIVWSPDGSYLSHAQPNGLISIWEIETGQIINQINEDYTRRLRDDEFFLVVNAMRWNADNVLAVAGWNRTVRIWNVIEGSVVASLEYPDSPEGLGIGGETGISDVAWTQDGTTLLAASTLTNISLWNAQTYQYIQAKESYGSSFALSIRADDALATGSYGVNVFPSYAESEHTFLPVRDDEVTWGDEVVVVQWSYDGSHILGVTFDGRTYIWNVRPDSGELVSLTRNLPYVALTQHVLFLDAEDWTVIEADGYIRRRSIEDDNIMEARALANIPSAAAWSPYGARVAYFTEDDASALHIEIPFASVEELTRIMERCQLDQSLNTTLNASIDGGELSTFIELVENTSDRSMPTGCREDLLAVAHSIGE